MTKEYIEREKAIKVIQQTSTISFTRSGTIDELNKIPNADVAEVKHVEWVNMVRAVIDTVGDCSECGKEAVWRTRNKPYALCPHCGAKMDGGADSE